MVRKNIVILGPTSSGKTSLALKLCEKFNGEIVSVDSRQVYKFMDVGTGKIPADSKAGFKKKNKFWEVGNIKVNGYDLVNPGSYFSAFDFANFVSKLKFTNPIIFFVGGTGFYFDILLGKKNVSFVSPNQSLRKKLSKLSKEKLYRMLSKLDPIKANLVDKNNPQRLIRAIEVVSGRANPKDGSRQILKDPLVIGLKSSNDFLYGRVDSWVESVFKKGLIEETQKLIKMGFGKTHQLRGINYKTVSLFLEGKIQKNKAIERVKFDNHAYIRRQLTYFKKMEGISWFDMSEKGFDTKITRLVESKLNE